ncbi:hypothetical protein FI667_g12823, partial [Globisporangium splendens]
MCRETRNFAGPEVLCPIRLETPHSSLLLCASAASAHANNCDTVTQVFPLSEFNVLESEKIVLEELGWYFELLQLTTNHLVGTEHSASTDEQQWNRKQEERNTFRKNTATWRLDPGFLSSSPAPAGALAFDLAFAFAAGGALFSVAGAGGDVVGSSTAVGGYTKSAGAAATCAGVVAEEFGDKKLVAVADHPVRACDRCVRCSAAHSQSVFPSAPPCGSITCGGRTGSPAFARFVSQSVIVDVFDRSEGSAGQRSAARRSGSSAVGDGVRRYSNQTTPSWLGTGGQPCSGWYSWRWSVIAFK